MRRLLSFGALVSGAMVVRCGGDVVYDKGSGRTAGAAGGATDASSAAVTLPASSTSTWSATDVSPITSSSASGSGGWIDVGPSVASAGGWTPGVGSVGGWSPVGVGSSITTDAVGSSSSVGGGGACGRETHETLAVTVATTGGPPYGCSLNISPFGGPPSSVHIQGVVIAASPEHCDISTCAPNQPCPPDNDVTQVHIVAPGLSNPDDVMIPVGAFVDLQMTETLTPGRCTDTIMIRNLVTWNTLPNIVMPNEYLWFAGSDGTLETLPGAPFGVSAQALGCFPNNPGCWGSHDDYELEFASPSMPSIAVPMGKSVLWGSTGALFDVHNLRSFASGLCDDAPAGEWGYWVRPAGHVK